MVDAAERHLALEFHKTAEIVFLVLPLANVVFPVNLAFQARDFRPLLAYPFPRLYVDHPSRDQSGEKIAVSLASHETLRGIWYPIFIKIA
jgi:hypothetical protein